MDISILGAFAPNDVQAQRQSASMANAPADDANDNNHIQRVATASRVERVPSIQFFLATSLGGRWISSNSNPKHFRLVAQFESDQRKWSSAKCINIDEPNDDRVYGITTSFDSPDFGNKAVIETYENLLHSYVRHPEAKSVGPDGQPCQSDTRGLLGRAHIIRGDTSESEKKSIRAETKVIIWNPSLSRLSNLTTG